VYVNVPYAVEGAVAGTAEVESGMGVECCNCNCGVGITSVRNPGRKRSSLACVAVHKVRWCSSRWSSWEGGTRMFAAFITRTTFLRDSETASY
jgi:hypothetical protein